MLKAMKNPDSGLRLVYVTPEKIAKVKDGCHTSMEI